jgi:hypothetical protein
MFTYHTPVYYGNEDYLSSGNCNHGVMDDNEPICYAVTHGMKNKSGF